MAQLTVTQLDAAGSSVASQTPNAGGDTIKCDDLTCIRVVNTNAATRDVTIAGAVTCDQGGTHNRVVTIPATTGDVTIPLLARYANASTGLASLTYTAVTGLTVFAWRN